MTDKPMANLPKVLTEDWRFLPAVAGAFLAGLLLLFIKDAPVFIRDHLVPGMVVYTLAAALIGYLQAMLGIRHNFERPDDEPREPLSDREFWSVVGLQAAWFICVVVFLLGRWPPLPPVP